MTPGTSPVRGIWVAALAVGMGVVGVLLALALFHTACDCPDIRPPVT